MKSATVASVVLFVSLASISVQVVESGGPPNSSAQQKKHYVVLVSLDGFFYDYPQKWGAPHIVELARTGATAPDGMLPAYPSITFPNHLMLVTGLYPEHHGIVANNFYDPTRGESYSSHDDKASSDGSWYSGTPLWSLAEQQGMRAACFFWPGSEAKIAGERPDEYVPFDTKFDDEKRIDQVEEWLRLPAPSRSHLITLYYANTDQVGHSFGPDSAEEGEAVRQVDQMVGKLKQRLDAKHLPIDLIVVSDHGMIKAHDEWIVLTSMRI